MGDMIKPDPREEELNELSTRLGHSTRKIAQLEEQLRLTKSEADTAEAWRQEHVKSAQQASDLQRVLDEMTKDRDSWKREWESRTSSWLRALGGKLFNKRHQIDALVLTTKTYYEAYEECEKVVAQDKERRKQRELAKMMGVEDLRFPDLSPLRPHAAIKLLNESWRWTQGKVPMEELRELLNYVRPV